MKKLSLLFLILSGCSNANSFEVGKTPANKAVDLASSDCIYLILPDGGRGWRCKYENEICYFRVPGSDLSCFEKQPD